MKDNKAQGPQTIMILMLGAKANICDGFTFEDEYELAKKTWAANLPDHIKLIYFDGGNYMKDEFVEDKEKNCYKLHLACEDDMKWTFKKTWMAYKFVSQRYDSDWIFRTNTSTYININTLDDFVQNEADPEITYGSDLYSLSEACCPWPLCIYARGNGILTHRQIYKNVIIQNGMSFAFSGICDDIVIGNLINTYNIIKHNRYGQRYVDYIKGLPHAWYKCVDQLFDNGHKFSKFGDSNLNYNDFVTVTVKKYREREKEKKHYLELHDKIESDPILKHVQTKWTDEMLEYVNKPSVFIGSILCYIDFDVWDKMDKNELMALELTHKASDDAEFWKYKEIQGKNI